jgi:type I restriction enzyme S subunit
MGLKRGYKQTEVGVIPEDWVVIDLSNLCTLQRGFDITEATKVTGTIPVYSSSGISYYHNKAIVWPPGVVTGRKGMLGKVFVVNEPFWPHDTTLWVKDFKGNHPTYVALILEHFHLERLDAATSVPTLNRNNLAGHPIAFPPTKAEQQAIAGALSDVDGLIESLEQIIVKKRHLKQGAMQKLLTGKNRLPGFSGEWRTRELGEVISHCSSGATPYRGRPEFYKGEIKWITSGELNYNFITDTLEKISKEAVEKTNLKLHPVGTFLMAITGLEAAGTRGACGIVGSPATTNQSCMAIYPTPELSTAYLYHYYVYRGNELALKYCQGTKQQSYTAKLVRILPINLPPTVEEQKAIAAVLSDMDAEVAALEDKLVKARRLKHGMMHNLLTGSIRLV